MTNYVWTATDKTGKKVIKEIKAATADDAKYVLLAQGYSNLELKEDEVIGAVQAGFAKAHSNASERLRHRDDPTVTYWDVFRKSAGPDFLIYLGLAFLAVYFGFQQERGFALICIVALLAQLLFVFYRGAQSVYYHKLVTAADWSRWSEVLSLVKTLKLIGRYRKVKVPESDLIRFRAKALAGMGRLDEALAEFQLCKGRPDRPDWLYTLFVGSLYMTAKQYDKAIECNLLSIAAKPTNTAWIDLANRYARYKRDPAKARAALAEAEKAPLPDFTKPFHLRCLGIIAYLEGNYGTARQHLESAIDMVEKARGRPYRDGHLSVARAYLCCVLAKQGEMPAARKCLALAQEYLIATKENELLAECRNLCGEP
jgi:tetratricopeptide (TPR) repeat protein